MRFWKKVLAALQAVNFGIVAIPATAKPVYDASNYRQNYTTHRTQSR